MALERTATGGYFEVSNMPSGGISNKLAPSQILDFHMVNNSHEDMSLTFEWSAVGEDLRGGGSGKQKCCKM